ncbi:MAG: hypothetical protein PHF67_05490 [Candidatus Nanoarchaeia archaeon]|nr:hypothetical protein [Candidatus Nanoarchaeia archaeon]
MKIIITIKDKKKDRTEEILYVASILEKKFKGVRIGKCKCYEDGTTLILEK